MRLLFLGTAAAEAYPAAFCDCDNCERARRNRGRDLRRRSSLLVDDDLLIDLGPDIMCAALAYGLRLHRLRTVLITHAHADHFDPGVLHWRKPGFRASEPTPLTIYGPPPVLRAIEAMQDLDQLGVTAQAVGPEEEFAVPAARVWTFPARHGSEVPLLYAVERDGRKFLYACDTGAPAEAVWSGLAGHRFDLIIMEETMGLSRSQLHSNIEEVTAHRARAEGRDSRAAGTIHRHAFLAWGQSRP